MNIFNLFLFLLLCCNAISCSEIQTSKNQQKQKNQQTLSTLFKLMHKPTKAKERKVFYEKNLNNFNLHTENLRNILYQELTQPETIDQIYTIHASTKQIRTTIINEDLIPLKYKIDTILNYVKHNNLYRISYCGQIFDKTEISPRIIIIESIINALKDDAFPLDDETIANYQYIVNHIAHFAVKKGHDKTVKYEKSCVHTTDEQTLAALQNITGNTYEAERLAQLLKEETLHKEALEKCKNNLETCLPYVS